MTFRAKPAVKRAHRPSWEVQGRRNLYLNLAFIGVIVLAVLILVAAAGVSYYDDHFGKVAVVNGTAITKDALRDRVKVDTFRLDHTESIIRDQLNTGKITQDQANTQLQQVTSLRNALPQSSLDKLVDATLQGQLAAKEGVTVTDQQVDAQLTKEATTPELRHAWIISVAPDVSSNTTGPTEQQKADAKAKIDGALADIKAGKKWEDVAKAVSGDGSASNGGDLGWTTQTGGEDQAFSDALFALPLNGVTDVVLGADGTYRIGRVTEIQPSAVDPNYQQKITDAGVSMSAYRDALRAEATQVALSDKITADAVNTATLQRQVSEIFISGTPGAPPQDEVDASHILISPGGDPSKVSSLAADDPAWAAAKAEADQIYAELQKDPSKFEELARTKSSDTVSGAQGGKLGWFKATDLVSEFSQAAFAPGLKDGQILPPVKTQYGWHIIRFEGRRADASIRIKDLHDQAVAGADFAALAKANSEGPQAADGGMLGWIAQNQIDKQQEDAIFATKVGGVSDVVSTSSGYYLFKVWQEQTRKPDGEQLKTLQTNAFDNWYAAQKKAAAIVEDQLSAATQ
jgi:parvulin-like peptidyl-prolyl isomerase